MLELLDLTQKNIIATRATDLLGIRDYEKIHPFIHNIIHAGQKARWYFEMVDSSLSTSAGFWEEIAIEMNYGNMVFTHAEDIEKIALVGNEKWKKLMYSIMKPFAKARIMYFDLTDKAKAFAWLINQEED